MPIHLPPISRRKFLSRTLVATAAVVAGQTAFAKKELDKSSWMFLSDIHIAADPATVAREINMTNNFLQAANEIVNWPTRPAGILISGDCAFDTGQLADYQMLAQHLQVLRQAGAPIHVTVGNHDDREHFWSALKEAKAMKRPMADRQASVIKSPLVNWFMLDSLEKTKATPGILGEQQRDWLKKALDANTDKPAVIVVHHNPDDGTFKGSLKDTKELFEIIRPHKQVKAYVFGHTHDWKVKQDESGIHLVNLPPTAYVFASGRPSGWVHAEVNPVGMKVELQCLNKKHEMNGQTFNLKWRV